MGEVSSEPEVAARAVEDLTKMDVDPAKGRATLQGGAHPIEQGVSLPSVGQNLEHG